jgi:hypothetical protein
MGDMGTWDTPSPADQRRFTWSDALALKMVASFPRTLGDSERVQEDDDGRQDGDEQLDEARGHC